MREYIVPALNRIRFIHELSKLGDDIIAVWNIKTWDTDTGNYSCQLCKQRF